MMIWNGMIGIFLGEVAYDRVVKSSLDDIQSKYDKATEEVALLQAELASTETMKIENQRLKDELRDLKEEWTILKEKAQSTTNGATPSPSTQRHHTPPSPPISDGSRALTPSMDSVSPPKALGVMGLGGVGGTGTWRGVRRGVGKRMSIASDVSWASEARQTSSVKIMHGMVSRVKVPLTLKVLTLESGSTSSSMPRPCQSPFRLITHEGRQLPHKRILFNITSEIS
jgi:hypothetical protein